MSQLNIQGLVNNISGKTSVFDPLMEALVNSIQAIEDSKRLDGKITIIVKREQPTLAFDDSGKPEISGFEIHDNGIGFDKNNRNSFDTLYSDWKIDRGCKGFGRAMFLRYYNEVKIESVFKDGDTFKKREFAFGRDKEFIINEKVKSAEEANDTRTTLYLNILNKGKFDKKLDTVARRLLEKLLIFFTDENYNCPQIIVKEDNDSSKEIILNDFLTADDNPEIQEVLTKDFTLIKGDNKEDFKVKVFKIFYLNAQKSKVLLTAHNREVTDSLLHSYVSEFEDEYYESFENDKGEKIKKNFVIRAYVLGNYLNDNVSLERIAFNFPEKDSNDPYYNFCSKEIEAAAAEEVKAVFKDEVSARTKKKHEKIEEYLKEYPWHRDLIPQLDLNQIPLNANHGDIQQAFNKIRYENDSNLKSEARGILEDDNFEFNDKVKELVTRINQAEMKELAEYVTLRKVVLEVFEKSLQRQTDQTYASEDTVHSILFPTKENSHSSPYDKNNLWIIDEKLNFAEFISSDQELGDGNHDRPDIVIYDKRIAFRGKNEAHNPITIFEFKKPREDEFTLPSAKKKKDPIYQIIKYANDIMNNQYLTPEGVDIKVGAGTPFYGYAVIDLTAKVKTWLRDEKDFTEMPDGEGWFKWFSNNNLYVEVISWQKMLNDAKARNKIFFHKLNIDQA